MYAHDRGNFRPDYEKRFPRTFCVGQEIYTTENGRFCMYGPSMMNIEERKYDD